MGDPGSNLHEFFELNNAMNGFMYQVQVNKAYLGSFGNRDQERICCAR